MLHIIQNDPDVPPGNLFEGLVIPYSIHHPYRDGLLPDPEQISALIVLGGAMGVNDDPRHPFLTPLKNLIRTVVAAGIPYLGICLGGQLLAAALGATVAAHRWEERGAMNVSLTAAGKADRLFEGIGEVFSTFQWHHDSFDLPPEGVLLATSAACPHQAFRVGATAWGLQFHPEVTEAIIYNWCAGDPSTNEKAGELVAAFSLNLENYRATSRRFLKNFLQSTALAV
jgi:GMP synthase-like glutamine amidotransferase